MNDEIEKQFVNAFIARDKRERWLTLLPDERKRVKLLNRLAHVGTEDLDPRFTFDKEKPPPEIAAQVQKLRKPWEGSQPDRLCYLIANGRRDGETMALEDAESDYDLTTGAIIILIPDKLAYYHTERDNISRQPFYVLYRP
jgi:hypothetical protein